MMNVKMAMMPVALVCGTVLTGESAAMRSRLPQAESERLYRARLCEPSGAPVSFEYDGVRHDGFGGLRTLVLDVRETPTGLSGSYTVEIAPGFTARLDSDYDRTYGARVVGAVRQRGQGPHETPEVIPLPV